MKCKEILSLNNVEVVALRAEEYIKEKRESFDVVTARAVSELRIICELALPFLKNSGIFIAYKGNNYNNELISSKQVLNKLNSSVKLVSKQILPFINEERFNVFISKNGTIDSKYPRPYSKIIKD